MPFSGGDERQSHGEHRISGLKCGGLQPPSCFVVRVPIQSTSFADQSSVDSKQVLASRNTVVRANPHPLVTLNDC